MAEPHAGELRAFLRAVRRRWRTAAALRALARAVGAGTAALGVVLALDRLAAPADLPLLAAAAAALLAAAVFALRPFWALRRPPSDRRVARYVEERCPELEDRLASAAGLSESAPAPFRALVLRDAARAVRRIALDRAMPARLLRRAFLAAATAGAVAAVVVVVGSPALGRIARSAWLHTVPFGAAIEVEPGDARVVAGEPLLIRAHLRGTPGEPIRTLPAVTVVRPGAGPEVLRMRRADEGYRLEVPAVRGGFTYRVSAGALASPDYTVTALEPPAIQRIEVGYRYPDHLGLAPRSDTGGDIHAPEGTAVTVTVVADKALRSGALRMASGAAVDLERRGDRQWAASFDVRRDDSYRVALVDADALANRDAADYLIRTVVDRPPEVRIERPGGDREITPLEETVIEARADDDFGVERFELVYTVAGRDEQAVDLLGARRARDVTAAHTLYAESLGVRPGDVIGYYVRARDTNAARPARETRSDIFFLEVRPFGREFSEAGSRFMAAMAGGDIGRLVRVQKEIVIATWRLDARPAAVRPPDDVEAVADTQEELRSAAARVAADREGGRRSPGADALARAIEAMRAAAASLRANDTAAAIPSEMAALNGLLQAQAEVRRTQVSLQPSPGGAFGPQPREDLSALFDRELRREQRTNYEDRAAATPPPAAEESEARRRVGELADRQEALNREAERALADADDDPQARRRTLERLTREQEELRRQMEDVERQLARRSNAGSGSRGGTPRAGGAGERIADRMREAQDALGRRDAQAATRAGREAANRLRDLAQELGAGGNGRAGRAIRDLEAEARRMADSQRRTALASRLAGGERAGRASRRALAGEREELAERVERFEARLDAQRSDAAGSVRRALDEAADGLAEADLAARLRNLAQRARAAPGDQRARAAPGDQRARAAPGDQRAGVSPGGEEPAAPDPDAPPVADEDESVAEELDRAAVRLQAAARAADEVARVGEELQRHIARIDRAIERMAGRADGESPGAAEPGEPAAAGGERPDAAEPGELAAAGRALAGRLGQSGELAERARALRPSLVEDLRRWAEHAFSGAAPGTEAFKQDLAEWESLRADVRLAIGRSPVPDADASGDGGGDALHVGPDERIPETYRGLVERYYRSLSERP